MLNSFPISRRTALAGLGTLAGGISTSGLTADDQSSAGMSRVRFKEKDGNIRTALGRVLVRFSDGLLLEEPSGRLWTVRSSQLIAEEKSDNAFQPLTSVDLGQVVAAEAIDAGVSSRFEVYESEHYVITANTGEAYARWCGALLERLKEAMFNFWKIRELDLSEPEFPLPVLILSRKEDYGKMAFYDATPASAQGQGYYLITGNRVVLYDLTSNGQASSARTISDVQRRLAKSPASVATAVHEATHQIAFNCGVHTRYADNPLWLSEGLAMYFETPDLTSRRGWRTVGKVSSVRLRQFRDFAAKRRRADSLHTLVRDNARLVDPDVAIDAYSESWALTHFLIRSRGRQYSEFVKKHAARPRLQFDKPEQRVATFEEGFGPLDILEKQFLNYVRRLRG